MLFKIKYLKKNKFLKTFFTKKIIELSLFYF